MKWFTYFFCLFVFAGCATKQPVVLTEEEVRQANLEKGTELLSSVFEYNKDIVIHLPNGRQVLVGRVFIAHPKFFDAFMKEQRQENELSSGLQANLYK